METNETRDVRSLRGPLYLVILASVVFLSRLPFLGPGYGNDPDAWRTANGVSDLVLDGRRLISPGLRGHPFQIFVYTFFWKWGPGVMNGLTAVVGTLGAVAFARILRSLGSRDYFLGALACAAVPVVYINSTNVMDYVWGLGLVLWALDALLSDRVVLSGILVGLATGCRITSLLVLIPFSILLFEHMENRQRFARLARLWAPACTVGLALFVKGILRHGISFLHFPEGAYPDLWKVLRHATVDVWGTTGVVAIMLAVVVFAIGTQLSARSLSTPRGTAVRRHLAAWSCAVLIYFALYLRLPHEAGYLVPIVPFVILLLFLLLPRRLYLGVCALLIVSPFLDIASPRLADGPIIANHLLRGEKVRLVESVLAAAREIEDHRAVIVAGSLLPQIKGTLGSPGAPPVPPGVEFAYAVDGVDIERSIAESVQPYFLPEGRAASMRIYGIDLDQYPISPLQPLQERDAR